MRARAAYIRSLGTTGILVVAALLMLGVVGALVGFHGWPQGAVGETVPSVPLKPAPEPVLSVVREVHKAPAVTREARVLGDRTATAGLVKQVPVSSPRPIGYPVAVAPGEVAPTTGVQQPPTAAHNPDAPAPPSAPSAPTPPPAPGPREVEALLTQLLGTVPPPPLGRDGQPLEVGVPIVGLTVTVPPGPSR
jgi:hypothetical protein